MTNDAAHKLLKCYLLIIAYRLRQAVIHFDGKMGTLWSD